MKRVRRELPAVGTELMHFFYGKVKYKARIVTDESFVSGKAIEFDGKRYDSLTGAAVAITGMSTNGWTFWRLKK
jgi:hypothetical protein